MPKLRTLWSMSCAIALIVGVGAPASANAQQPDFTAATTMSLDGGGWRVSDFEPGAGIAQGVQQPGYDDTGWYTSDVPADAYQVLLAHQAIDDPFKNGSTDYTWPGSKEWWYRKHFVAPVGMDGELVRLHVEGVMENSDVYLNGALVGKTTGMYDDEYFDVSSNLLYGNDNVLAIRAYATDGSWTTYPSIAANSTYWKGFQYGQNIRVLGMWRGVELVASGPVYVKDTFTRTVGDLTATSTSATLRVTHTLVNTSDTTREATLLWHLEGSDFSMPPLTGAQQVTLMPGVNEVTYDIVVSGDRLHLWWPNDFGTNLPNGDRYLYKLTASLAGDPHEQSSQVTDDIGIRSLTYRMTPGAATDDYPLEYVVNGEPIYMQGGNWVPSDGLYRIDVMSRNYERDLLLMRDAHFRMLRVWGGGIEENPEFYQLASKYGIMILQEFWQFQASYQADPTLWETNAGDIIKRLRNYPAIARYDGGNELTGVTGGDREKGESLPYVQLLQQAYEKYDGTRGDFLATDPAGGSCHRWDHLHMIGVEGYELDHGDPCDFLSELGMNAAPSESTLALEDGVDGARNAYRAVGSEYVYPNEFGAYTDTSDMVAKTQLAQAIGMSYNMSWAKARKWSTAGSLVWQANDMAPMVGWGAIDFGNQPKEAYYYLARAYAPISIAAVYDKYYFAPGEAFTVDVHALNDTTQALRDYTADAKLMSFDGTTLGDQHKVITVPANAEGGALQAFTAAFTAPSQRGVFLLHLTLSDAGGRQVASNDVLFTTEPNRSLYTLATDAHPGDLILTSDSANGSRTATVTNPSTKPAYGIDIVTANNVRASDNFFTLMPGESESVTLKNWDGAPYTGDVSVTQVGAQPASENLALGKPTYASQDDYTYRTGTNTHSDRLALYAADGDAMYTADSNYSQWQGKTKGAAWLEVDLGRRQPVSQVTVEWGKGHGVDYAIQVSDDATNWTTVASVTSGKGGAAVLPFASVDARYVRLAGTSSTGEYDVRELQVYDHDVAAPGYSYVPGAVELERLPNAELGGGANRNTVRDDALSDGAADRIVGTGAGASVGYPIGVQARAYDVRVGVRTQPSGGTFQLSIGGDAQGNAQDTYSATPAVKEIDLGDRTFTNGGTTTFDFKGTAKNAASSGYDLDLDYVLLVPLDHVYEAEDLTATTNPGVSHASFTDPRMSGGQGDKLSANGVGDYVEYGVDIPAAGRYSIVVGLKKQDTRGIFQLSIDGAVQGVPQDTYAPSDTYGEVLLGAHAFATPGNHEFRFTVTGKNPASLGYSLAVDYIKLGPPPPPGCTPSDGRYEAECLTATTSAGDSHTAFSDANMSNGGGDKLGANAAGDYVAYQLNVPQTGDYDVKVGVKEQDTRGIFQLSIDGADVGEPHDTYAASDTYAEIDFGRHKLSAGTHEVRFTVTGRNAASIGYSLAVDYIDIGNPLPPLCLFTNGRVEAECLPATTSPGDGRTPFADSYMSGGKGDKFSPNAIGDYIAYSVDVPAAGTYDLGVGVKAQDSRGTFQLSVDGTDVGQPQDTYAPSDTYRRLDMGTVTFATAGTHELRFTLTGKNPASLGYSLAFDYFELVMP